MGVEQNGEKKWADDVAKAAVLIRIKRNRTFLDRIHPAEQRTPNRTCYSRNRHVGVLESADKGKRRRHS